MGTWAMTEDTLTMVGEALAPGTAATMRGAKAVTTSKRPKTFESNIFLTRAGSASMAGASYTEPLVDFPRSEQIRRVQIRLFRHMIEVGYQECKNGGGGKQGAAY
jgi:hypothetical protein